MKSCLVIEDDFSFFLSTESILKTLGFDLIENVTSISTLKEKWKSKKYDLVISDLVLDDGEISLDYIKHNPISSPIIFTSVLKDDKIFSEIQSSQKHLYLVKPVDRFTLQSSIEFLNQSAGHHGENGSGESHDIDKLVISDGSAILRVDIKDIIYAKSEGNYCTFFNKDKKFTTRNKISDFENILDRTRFVRVHRSYLISLENVSVVKFSKNRIIMENTVIPIGRKYKNHFRKVIQEYDKQKIV